MARRMPWELLACLVKCQSCLTVCDGGKQHGMRGLAFRLLCSLFMSIKFLMPLSGWYAGNGKSFDR